MRFEKSCFWKPIVEGRPYLPGPGPVEKRNKPSAILIASSNLPAVKIKTVNISIKYWTIRRNRSSNFPFPHKICLIVQFIVLNETQFQLWQVYVGYFLPQDGNKLAYNSEIN